MHTIFSLQTLFVASFYAMFVIDWNWFCLFAVKGRLAQTGRDYAAGKGKGAKDAFRGEILRCQLSVKIYHNPQEA